MEKEKLKGMVFSALFAALTAAVAWFKIPLPFTPVPITLQTLIVLLSGAMLGSYYGALSMIIYIAVGAIGLPVFAGGASGIGVLLGPTGGYLFSYPIAAYVIGYMTEKKVIDKLQKYSLAIIMAVFMFIIFAYYDFLSFVGIFLLIWFVVIFLFGKLLENKKLNSFLKYFSFFIIVFFVLIVFLDSLLKIGIMKLGDKVMISILSEQQRIILAIVGLIVILLLLFLIFYSKKSKLFSSDTILAMFAGTLIIYILGSVQGKIVTGLPWGAIFVGWVLPFIVGDTIKLLLAAYIAKNVDIKNYMK